MANRGSHRDNGPDRDQRSKVSSDPLFSSGSHLDASFALWKTCPTREIYSGLEGLPQITKISYNKLKHSFSFDKVPLAAYAYYVAVLAYSRLLNIGVPFRDTREERDFIEITQTNGFSLALPSEILVYLQGIGSVTSPHCGKLKFAKALTEYQRSGEIPGYFGRVNQDTHYLYSTYPCLAVYAQRIKEDILFTRNSKRHKNWDLPEDIRPLDEGAGHPNENMLGWAPAMKLTKGQVGFLKEHGYNEDGNTKFDFEDWPIKHQLLQKISWILQCNVGVESICSQPRTSSFEGSPGSQAQLLHIHSTDNQLKPMLMNELVAYSPVKLRPSIVENGTAAIYRVFRNVNEGAIKNWAIYNFTNFTLVPKEWIETCNRLREKEPTFLSLKEFQVASYDLLSAAKIFQENFGQYRIYRY